jgi:hypothetical protein
MPKRYRRATPDLALRVVINAPPLVEPVSGDSQGSGAILTRRGAQGAGLVQAARAAVAAMGTLNWLSSVERQAMLHMHEKVLEQGGAESLAWASENQARRKQPARPIA